MGCFHFVYWLNTYQVIPPLQDFQVYTTWKEFYKPTFLEVLQEFSSLELSAAFLLSQLPLLKPRLYSISSSPDLHPQEIHLTVAVVSYHTQGTGNLFPTYHLLMYIWAVELFTRCRTSWITEEMYLLLSYLMLSLEGKGPLHFGLCSTWLNTIKEGDMVPCFVHRYPSYYIPKMYKIIFFSS